MTTTTTTPPEGLHVLRALMIARAKMPVLVAAVQGEGVDGRDFFYPSDDDLRVAADRAFGEAGLMLVPDEQAMEVSGPDAMLRWQLVHLETGDSRAYRLTWGRYDDGPRSSAAAAWATAATWSHATRHLQLKLLNARVITKAEYARLNFEKAGADYDKLCGELPAWATSSPTTPEGILAAIDGVLAGVAQLAGGSTSEECEALLEPVRKRVRALARVAEASSPPPAPPAEPRPAQPFDRLAITEPLRRWKEREHAARRAAEPGASLPTMADAWAAATGQRPRQPVNGEEFKQLHDYLLAEDARHGGAT